MTWQLTPHSVALPLPLSLSFPCLTATNISDIIYHQPACQSSHWVQKITAPSKRGARPLRTLMTRPHPATPLPSLLQCVILGLCCQKIIMPINFTHAGCTSSPPSPSLFLAPSRPANFIQCRFGGKLHNKKLCLPFASSEWACPRPRPLPLLPAVCVCRLRLILPHSFGSNLSCHAVIMTNKKRTGEKNYLLKMIMHRELGRWRRSSPAPLSSGVATGLGSLVFSPVNDSMTPWS